MEEVVGGVTLEVEGVVTFKCVGRGGGGVTLAGVGGVDGWCYLGVSGVSREPLNEGGVVFTGQQSHQHTHRLGAMATVLTLLQHLKRSNFIRTAQPLYI